MNESSLELLKQTVENLRDPNELAVGHERTYDLVRNWLIGPVDKRGCGFDATFVDRIMPVVVDKVRKGELKFDKAIDFDVYLKNLCKKYEEDVVGKSAEIREKLFWTEYAQQQKAGLVLLKDLTDQNESLKRGVLWLLIITGLSVSVATLAVLLLTRF
jgi:hypothetical protein